MIGGGVYHHKSPFGEEAKDEEQNIFYVDLPEEHDHEYKFENFYF